MRQIVVTIVFAVITNNCVVHVALLGVSVCVIA